ncbi:hypothetical protein T265_02544 [Opisthorchis viverrini]|uniref:Uncharacterized protein n=1 Tax=Opisthorchis viverrini TaxID=6198 RepID=A0A074ZUV8_OPIVI|nr:hypothetical protein T265_02544 [Opisthorchis viverrini]KER31228.1 hypothetical protein T265_02544 [Opisthorchis viverrini]
MITKLKGDVGRVLRFLVPLDKQRHQAQLGSSGRHGLNRLHTYTNRRSWQHGFPKRNKNESSLFDPFVSVDHFQSRVVVWLYVAQYSMYDVLSRDRLLKVSHSRHLPVNLAFGGDSIGCIGFAILEVEHKMDGNSGTDEPQMDSAGPVPQSWAGHQRISPGLPENFLFERDRKLRIEQLHR